MTTAVQEPREDVSFLSITVQPTTVSGLLALVGNAINARDKCVIANHNLHSLYLFHRIPRLRAFFKQSKWTHIDGMAMVALARIYGWRVKREQRVTYVDLTGPLMALAAQEEWRIFYLGARPGVAGRGSVQLRKGYPGLRIRAMHGFFDSTFGSPENEEVLRMINSYKPHILMVGMGMPRQELWIQENLSHLSANVILPSGAAIDYVAGCVPTPPRWAGRIGLEWMFRLLSEPRRLWRRYLVEPWSIARVMISEYGQRSDTVQEMTASANKQ